MGVILGWHLLPAPYGRSESRMPAWRTQKSVPVKRVKGGKISEKNCSLPLRQLSESGGDRVK